MNEKPILFNTEMVCAILDGRKTQTRRPCKSEKAPYQVGDILYVRETCLELDNCCVAYKAKNANYYVIQELHSEAKVIPSIHMPKEYARIFLKVTKVRKQCIFDVSAEEAIKEGFRSRGDFYTEIGNIYGTLEKCPYVWAIEFEVIEVK